MSRIIVERLDRKENYGDWHDKPLAWKVVGPNSEVQKFSTKRESERYATIRRRSIDQPSAIRAF